MLLAPSVFGRLYTGGKEGGEELKFVCEFLVGRH